MKVDSMNANSMKLATIHVSGRVQGVCYRWFVEEHAKELGLRGYVMNLGDGRVKIVVEGEVSKIEELIDILKNKKPSLARIDNIEVAWDKYTGDFDDFGIRF